ncbi:MAG: hypothetical protein WCP60_07640 [bacterium]
MKKTLTLLAVVLATAATSFAGEAVSSKKVVVAPVQDNLFRAGEVQLDVFVAGAAGRFNGRNANGLGGGLGLSYFFTRYFGIGVDDTLGGLSSARGKVFDNLQGNLIARYPIESWHLAPYAIAGGGATWGNNKAQGNGNVGGGLEYRINRAVGLFVDSRYIYGNKGLNESLSRAGVRFVF